MDAKLRALKVVDLKAVLAKANVSAPAKATKNDLIARIQASKDALAAYAELYPQDDLLAPPEEVDWNVEDTTAEPKEAAAPAPEPAAAPAPAVATPASPAKPAPAATATPAEAAIETAASSTPAEDPELEKRRQRAARFGIPLVEPKQKKSAAKPAPPGTDPKKLEERARRFGIPAATTTATSDATNGKANGKKRPAPQAEEVDPEELERRRKRAERFGINNNKA
ncbi:hypothetical protein CVT26_015712 [Gymnopilus dilepis]|uniref:THO1-MOS11 C-terminal domain-containing protein n=1 Tax=Gymnopilus dilepis TaxID=231916 RepID=A0A409VFG8_9AGAR|nr:hypothetical protein CVT26_015712 [Gymnopilus dilepis]